MSARTHRTNANEACSGMPRSFSACRMRGVVLAWAFVLAPMALAAGPSSAPPSASTDSMVGPHAEAIRLVAEQRRDEILALDGGKTARWFDARTRSWSAKRPSEPGVFDTRFTFEVTYAIDGERVGRWLVNTCTGHVAGRGERLRGCEGVPTPE